jgi:valyl-tRNA synthetase
VIADPVAEMDMGTGAMTITPAHSFADFELAQKYKLPIEQIIDKEGKLTEAAGPLAGLPVKEARQKVVEILQKKGLVDRIDHDYVHNLSVCYRCGTPVEPLVSEQWFVAVDKKLPGRHKTLKQLAREAVTSGEIKILPSRFVKVYDHWLNNLHDWCISRQIWWGHQLPVWYTNDGEVIVAPNEVEALKLAGDKKITRDPDTLDTWFSSALWTFSTLGWPELTKDLKQFHPTSVLETGYDILFFWVARMILMTEYLLKTKPFEVVYLHGIIRDKEGRKMSKSLGNGIDPLDMIDKFGTDALRLSLVIGSAPGADLAIYEEKIAGYRNFVNKLWNISRFILTSVDEVRSIKKQPKAKTLADQWILAEFNQLIKTMTESLDNFKFSEAGTELYHFTWGDLADWYLEIAKIEKDKDEILLYILERLLILAHPFTPFVTEVIWQNFKGGLLMVSPWPQANKFATKTIDVFAKLKELVTGLRDLKAVEKISPAELSDCYIENLSQDYWPLVAKLARVNLLKDKINIEPKWLGGFPVYISLQKKLTSKIKQELEKYIKSLEAKLQNEKFIKQAPKAVIEETKKKLAEARKKLL